MNSRNAILAVIFSALIVVFGLRQSSAAQPNVADCVQLAINGETVYESAACTKPTSTPEPTATDVPPTETPIPPTPTNEPGGPIDPYPDAPPCDVHDNKTYHGLWDYDLGCHYDHQHGDDLHVLDGALGTEIFALAGGDGMGAPWQTVNSEGYLENDVKHAGYIGYARSDMPCQNSPCVNSVRVMVHQHTIADASVRFHSSLVEGTTSDGGFFRFTPHIDFGDLHVPEGTRVIDVEGNHCGSTTNPGNHRQHAVEGGSRAPSNIWYGRSRLNSDVAVDRECGFVQLGTSAQDPWIWTSQEGPTYQGNFVCYPNSRCRNNATSYRMHLFTIFMIDDPRFNFIYDENGVANFEGWADRYGVPYEDGNGCTAPSIDCTPFVVRGLQRGVNYGTHPAYTEQFYQDHDIYFDNRPAGWAQPVN